MTTNTISIEKIQNILKTAFQKEGLLLSGFVWDESVKVFQTKTPNRIEFTATLIDEWDEENENYFTVEVTLHEWVNDPTGYYEILVFGNPDEDWIFVEGEYTK